MVPFMVGRAGQNRARGPRIALNPRIWGCSEGFWQLFFIVPQDTWGLPVVFFEFIYFWGPESPGNLTKPRIRPFFAPIRWLAGRPSAPITAPITALPTVNDWTQRDKRQTERVRDNRQSERQQAEWETAGRVRDSRQSERQQTEWETTGRVNNWLV